MSPLAPTVPAGAAGTPSEPHLPDWIDLNDWMVLNRPEVHRATRYLGNMALQTGLWTDLWCAAQADRPEAVR